MQIKKWPARAWALILGLTLFSLIMVSLGGAIHSVQWVVELLT